MPSPYNRVNVSLGYTTNRRHPKVTVKFPDAPLVIRFIWSKSKKRYVFTNTSPWAGENSILYDLRYVLPQFDFHLKQER